VLDPFYYFRTMSQVSRAWFLTGRVVPRTSKPTFLQTNPTMMMRRRRTARRRPPLRPPSLPAPWTAALLLLSVFMCAAECSSIDAESTGRRRRRQAADPPAQETSSSSSYVTAYSYEAAGATSSDMESAPPWMNVNETTCYLSSWTEGRGSNGTNSSSSTTDLPLLTLTGVVPGCGAAGAGSAASSSFLSLNLLREQQPPNGAGAAGGTNVRNASGVFGTVRKNSMYSGYNYSLDLVVQLNVPSIMLSAEKASLAEDDDSVGSSPGTLSSTYLPDIVVGYVRLVFCDALQMASCDSITKGANEQQPEGPDSPSSLLPIDYTNYLALEDPVSNSSNSSNSSSNTTVDPGPHRNQSYAGGVDATYLPLVGNGGDGDFPGVISSPWLAITLRPTSSNGTYRARHVYTASLAGNVTSGVRASLRQCCVPQGLVVNTGLTHALHFFFRTGILRYGTRPLHL
jgi:hypothetical protein